MAQMKQVGDMISDITVFGRSAFYTKNQCKKEEPEAVEETFQNAAVSLRTPEKANPGEILKMIQQPKSITYAKYNMTAVQEDIFTLIVEQVEKYMQNKSSAIRLDLFQQLYIELDLSTLFPDVKNIRRLVEEIKGMVKVDFEFKWTSKFLHSETARQMFASSELDADEVEIETTGILVSTCNYIHKQRTMYLHINPWSIPYLLYFGKGVGGTRYFKEIALSLPGKYSKRIYKMIMDWRTSGEIHNMPLAEFRRIFEIPSSYDTGKIKSFILERAKKEIDESGSPIKFEFKLTRENPKTSPTKNAYDNIRFVIIGIKKDVNTAKKLNADYQLLYNFIVTVADKGCDNKCTKATADIMKDAKKHKLIIQKFQYYYNELKVRNITKMEYKNKMLTILKDETGFDLRTTSHIRNSEMHKTRKGMREASKNNSQG